MTIDNAYHQAGYKESHGAATKVNARPEVKARVAELFEARASVGPAEVAEVVETLTALGEEARRLGNAAGVQAARACLIDAARLKGLLSPAPPPPDPAADPPPPGPAAEPAAPGPPMVAGFVLHRPLTQEEWNAKWAKPGFEGVEQPLPPTQPAPPRTR